MPARGPRVHAAVVAARLCAATAALVGMFIMHGASADHELPGVHGHRAGMAAMTSTPSAAGSVHFAVVAREGEAGHAATAHLKCQFTQPTDTSHPSEPAQVSVTPVGEAARWAAIASSPDQRGPPAPALARLCISRT